MGQRAWSWIWSSQQMVSQYWCMMRLWTGPPMGRDHSASWECLSLLNWMQLLNIDSGGNCECTSKKGIVHPKKMTIRFMRQNVCAFHHQGQVCWREDPNSGGGGGGMHQTAARHLLRCQRSPRWGAAGDRNKHNTDWNGSSFSADTRLSRQHFNLFKCSSATTSCGFAALPTDSVAF